MSSTDVKLQSKPSRSRLNSFESMVGRCAEDVLRLIEPPGFDALVWQAYLYYVVPCPYFEQTEIF